MPTTKPILAWHFCGENKRTQYTDEPIEVGQTLTCKGNLVLCKNGLHASIKALDALQYAPGPVVCRVRLKGKIVEGDDKLCARKRTVLAMADASAVLHEFTCRCAERVLLREREAGREPDPRSWATIKSKRQWLKGEITDEQLDAAMDAARAAAWAAAWDAAAWDDERRWQNETLTAMLLEFLELKEPSSCLSA